MMNPQVFRQYDVRGHAARDFADADVQAMGLAFARVIAADPRAPGAPARPSIVIGRDCRTSSPRLVAAFAKGALGACDVIDVGEVATPLLYFASHHLRAAAAVMITGSHNPADENGFKFVAFGEPFFDAQLTELAAQTAAIAAAPALLPAVGRQTTEDLAEAYLRFATSSLRLGPRRCKVVLDGGNGMGGPIAEKLYRRLGFDVVGQFIEPDGAFPNHHPDPTVAENLAALIARVRAEGAELGIAFDGDGDRLGVVDQSGRILWGDQLMILLGRQLLREVPGAKFIGEVKCSQTMFDALTAAGGEVEMWAVGHSRIKQRLRQTGAHLAGEMSGHIFFAHRYLGFDDGVYAGARVLEMLSQGSASLAQLAAQLPPTFATPELRLPCAEADKFDLIARCRAALARDPEVTAINAIDGVRASVAGGWLLLRASNTGAFLVMRCEAGSEAQLARLTAKAHRLLQTCAPAAP